MASDSFNVGTRGSDASDAELHPSDAAALDALASAGFDPKGLDGCLDAGLSPDVRERAMRLARLMGLLAAPVAGETGQARADLADITVARVLRTPAVPALHLTESAWDAGDAELHPEDAEALDSYVTGGYRLSKVPAELRDRAQRVDAVGRLVGMPAGERSDHAALIERTLARVARTSRPTVDVAMPRSGGFRLADLFSVAALLALAAGLLFPVASAVRSSSSMASCGSNFASIASALGRYANDFRGELPVASGPRGPGATWWNVGRQGESNSANLYRLAGASYASLDDLACAGNADATHGRCDGRAEDWSSLDNVSYSYHVMFGTQRPRWDMADAGTVVLADRSPVVRRAVRGLPIFPLENSGNHAGRGQTALRADGSAKWLATPMNGSDNIWLPAAFEESLREGSRQLHGRPGIVVIRMSGNELPLDAGDSLLGP